MLEISYFTYSGSPRGYVWYTCLQVLSPAFCPLPLCMHLAAFIHYSIHPDTPHHPEVRAAADAWRGKFKFMSHVD